MAMKPDKEIIMMWQGFVVGALYTSLTFILWIFCAVIIYSFFCVNLQPPFGVLSATGLAALIICLIVNFLGKRRPG
jgi:hypothetical protein